MGLFKSGLAGVEGRPGVWTRRRGQVGVPTWAAGISGDLEAGKGR